MKRLRNIILFVLIAIFAAAAIVVLAIQTRPFKNWLADFVSSTVSKNLNAEVSIGRIEGNFFRHLDITNTTLTFENDTLAHIPRLSLAYNPRDLLRKRITLSLIQLDSPSFLIRQYADSSWEFSQITKESAPDSTIQSTEKESSAFDWTIHIRQFELLHLNARIAAIDSMIPQDISDLNLELSAFVSSDKKSLDLKKFTFQTIKPDFELASLTFNLEQNPDGLSLQDFALKTAKNQVDASATVELDQPPSGSVEASTTPIHFSEFQFVLPNINIKGKPQLDLQSTLINDQLDGALVITSDKSRIDIKAKVQEFSGFLADSSTTEPHYQLDVLFDNIHLSDWTANVENNILVGGNIVVSGQGISAETADIKADIQLVDSRFDDRSIDRLTANAAYKKGNARATLDLQSDMGQAQVRASVNSLLTAPQFTATVACRNLNLDPLLRDSSMVSDLNFDLKAQGRSFSLEEMRADVEFFLSPSVFYDVEFDTAFVNASLLNQEIIVETLKVKSATATLNANGHIRPEGDSEVSLTLNASNLALLKRFVPADTLDGSVHLMSQVSGQMDSLRFKGVVDLDSVQYNEYRVDSLLLDLAGIKKQNDITGTVSANVNTIDAGAFLLNDVQLDAELTPDHIDLKTSLRQGETLTAKTHLQYLLNELPIILVKQLEVDVSGRQWRGGSDSTSIMLGKDEYIVTDFLIERQDSDTTKAQVYIDGTVRLDGDENFSVRVQNYNLASLNTFLEGQPDFGGVVDLDIQLTGTADRPIFDIDMDVKNIHYDDYRINQARGSLQYDKNEFALQFTLIPVSDSLLLRGMVPVHFSLAEAKFDILRDQPFHAELFANKMPIHSIIPTSLGVDRLSGVIDLDIKADNTLSDISPSGSITVTDGAFRYQELGAGFDNFDLNLAVQKDSLILHQFIGRNGEGRINITGFAALDSSIFSGVLNAIKLDLNATKFYLSRKSEHEIQINSDISLDGPIDSLQFDGSLEILRSSFYLPELTKAGPNAGAQRRRPLLIKALDKAEYDSLKIDTTVVTAEQQDASPILKNMRGKLTVSIPRNTWIKSDNMRVELSGNVDILKNAEYFEIFGPVQIQRGQYDFLGRRFKLTEGTASFQGGESINPVLNVTAEYTFRDSQREKHIVSLKVTDDAQTPNIKFLLDDEPITEGEAASYILFNRSPDEVTGQASPNTSGNGYQASDLIYGLMSAELSKHFGQQLGVDYLEIKGRDNLSEATFIVGKYVTPDLFMSYEHYIGTLEEDQAPQVVTVEYELTKYLFLQLISGDTKTTGADIIIKFDHE